MIPTFVQTSLYSAVLALFSSGASGTFLDANDWGPTGTGGTGVCFQDLSGTPVTAMEQPVQLILDKSQGLALGAELVTNGTNITTTTGWTGQNGATVSAVGGKLRVTGNGSTAFPYSSTPITTVVGKWYKLTATSANVSGASTSFFVAKSDSAGSNVNVVTGVTPGAAGVSTCYFLATATTSYVWVESNAATSVVDWTSISCKQIAGNHAYVSASANRPTITARYNLLLATAVLSTQSVTVGAGSYTLYFTGSGSVALSGAATGTKTAGSNVITCTAGTLTLTVTGSVLTADLRPSDQATGLIPQYQRVNTATDYDWSPAFPPMIKGNGSNQYLTGNLDLSSTNKVTVWAGVRKLSDSSAGVVVELSANFVTNAGAFTMLAPQTAHDYAIGSGGTTPVGSGNITTYTAPITNVLNLQANIASPSLVSRINGVQTSSTSSSQGTGNYGNYPFYLLSRAGTSLFFNGGFNVLLIVGKAATASEISVGESYCNLKLRAY